MITHLEPDILECEVNQEIDKYLLSIYGVITHLEPDILECEVGLRKHYYEQS